MGEHYEFNSSAFDASDTKSIHSFSPVMSENEEINRLRMELAKRDRELAESKHAL